MQYTLLYVTGAIGSIHVLIREVSYISSVVLNREVCIPAGQSVRLVSMKERTSSSVTAGRLEILSNGRWGSVCNSGFDYSEARVACRQLGFSSYINYGTVGAYGMG